LLSHVNDGREMIKDPEFLAKRGKSAAGRWKRSAERSRCDRMLGVLFADSDNADAIMALEAMTQSEEWDSHRTGDVRAG